MTIIAKETRSRLSWMNSLISIAQVRRQKPPEERARGAVVWTNVLIGNYPWPGP